MREDLVCLYSTNPLTTSGDFLLETKMSFKSLPPSIVYNTIAKSEVYKTEFYKWIKALNEEYYNKGYKDGLAETKRQFIGD
jgi:hypothetical protein